MCKKLVTSLRGSNRPLAVVNSAVAVAIACGLAMQAAPDAKSKITTTYQNEEQVAIVRRARTQPASGNTSADVRVDVNVVLIPVTVTDPLGTPLQGLPPETFQVFEDGIEQQVTYFANEDAPISVGLLFDASGSMENKMDESRDAVAHLFKASMTGDEYFLIEFNDAPKIVCGFTTDPEELQHSLMFVRPKGWTSLLDAVYLGISKMRSAKNSRRALFILSDGGDNNSRYSESEIRSLVKESDVTIYAVGMLGWGVSRRNSKILTELAEDTGGKFFPVARLSDLPETMAKVSAAMRDQYLLGYTPSDRRNDGKYRRVQIRLHPAPDLPPLRATWRAGYYPLPNFN
jgi:Ca-activated chloride channel homolog